MTKKTPPHLKTRIPAPPVEGPPDPEPITAAQIETAVRASLTRGAAMLANANAPMPALTAPHDIIAVMSTRARYRANAAFLHGNVEGVLAVARAQGDITREKYVALLKDARSVFGGVPTG